MLTGAKAVTMFCVIAFALCSCAQQTPQGAAVTMTVTNEQGNPVKGAVITISSTTAAEPIPDIAPITDERGQVMWERLPPGKYSFRAAAQGFQPKDLSCEIRAGQSATLEFRLQPSN